MPLNHRTLMVAAGLTTLVNVGVLGWLIETPLPSAELQHMGELEVTRGLEDGAGTTPVQHGPGIEALDRILAHRIAVEAAEKGVPVKAWLPAPPIRDRALHASDPADPAVLALVDAYRDGLSRLRERTAK